MENGRSFEYALGFSTEPNEAETLMPKDAVTLTDHRTGKTYDIELVDGALPAPALRQVQTPSDSFGLMSYDPAFLNTASCKSRITFIDGGEGILEYRGYPIEQLAEGHRFLDVAWLLLEGELPSRSESETWRNAINGQRGVHETLQNILRAFPRDAHPMGMLISALGALGTLHPEAKQVGDRGVRLRQIQRILGAVATIAAYSYRHGRGLGFLEPDPRLSYSGNFLKMVFGKEGESYDPPEVLERALDTLFVLHADHEQNCSTNAMRAVGSSHVDPMSAMAAATAALYGPLHGGANEAVLRMLDEIGSRDAIPGFIERVKAGEGRLMGFGHRVYKNYDPRAKIIKQLADEVFRELGTNSRLEIALELERIALEDEYFVERKLYPNVDFYSGLIYESMGFPVGLFPVLFAVGRSAGWLAQWDEFHRDSEQKIARPRQIYLGPSRRDVPSN